MSVIATFTVPADDFTLGGTISGNPTIRIRLDRVIPIGDTFIPYFWASDESVEVIMADLEEEADIESFEVIERMNGEALIRAEWDENVNGLLEVLAATGATILEGTGESGTWRLELRFDDHDNLSSFFQRCTERGIALELESIHNPGMSRPPRLQSNLTNVQRETLSTALSEGYFDVPRRIDLVELAERLNVSDSAVSQRLRRGVTTVLEEMISELEAPHDSDHN